MTAKWAKGTGGPAGDEDQNLVLSVTGTTTHAPTAEGHDASEDGTGRGTPIIYAAEVVPALLAGANDTGGTRPPGTMVETAESLVAYQKVRRSGERGPDGELPPEVWAERDVAATLSPADLTSEHRAVELVAFALRGRDDGALPEVHGDGQTVGSLRAASGGSSRDYIAGTTVRRLTPLEAERLQGYPDGWTLTSNGKPQSDAARYKQLGNSIAVPVFAWAAKRLVAVDQAIAERAAA